MKHRKPPPSLPSATHIRTARTLRPARSQEGSALSNAPPRLNTGAGFGSDGGGVIWKLLRTAGTTGTQGHALGPWNPQGPLPWASPIQSCRTSSTHPELGGQGWGQEWVLPTSLDPTLPLPDHHDNPEPKVIAIRCRELWCHSPLVQDVPRTPTEYVEPPTGAGLDESSHGPSVTPDPADTEGPEPNSVSPEDGVQCRSHPNTDPHIPPVFGHPPTPNYHQREVHRGTLTVMKHRNPEPWVLRALYADRNAVLNS